MGRFSHTKRFYKQIMMTKWNDSQRRLSSSHTFFRNTLLPLLSLEARACINSKREQAEVRPYPAWHSTLPSVMEMMLLLWLHTVLLNYWMASQYLFVCVCIYSPTTDKWCRLECLKQHCTTFQLQNNRFKIILSLHWHVIRWMAPPFPFPLCTLCGC